MKRIYDFESLVIGEKYFVKSGIWSGNVTYCGQVAEPNKYVFCFGDDAESWRTRFNITACKSNLKVYNNPM